MAYETIITEQRGHVGLITFNRPKALNALNSVLLRELIDVLEAWDANDKIGSIVITGSEKAFAAGADVKEMADKSFSEAYSERLYSGWDRVCATRKPKIAAVGGYALGGGCEVAMMCDILLASETAKFGLPEITLGVMPGMGGTQRLVRAVGKAKAMELILTGRQLTAEEAERAGLVSRLVPSEDLLEEALKVAERIAGLSSPAVMLAKQTIERAFETTLSEGILHERQVFWSMFATEDQKEGMKAFIEKRSPQFRHK